MNKIKNSKKGFTLLELLVVVLIIGILAAIALPQYQLAVGKARFAELKEETKAFQQAAQRYYMINGTYYGISGKINKTLDIQLPNASNCGIWEEGYADQIRCCKTIFKKTMCLYLKRETGIPLSCLVYSKTKTDITNRICQKETGKSASRALCGDSYCSYWY